jgi:rubrerythrin
MARIQKMMDPILKIDHFSSFTVLGDPGCDGLGTEILSLYTQALTGAQGDLILIAGDLVPVGDEIYYRQMDALTERASGAPVYMLRGNHDTGAYQEHYGRSVYALHDDQTLLVVLDDSTGEISEESFALLRRAAEEIPCRYLIIALHIPFPNHYTQRTVPASQWDRVRGILTEANCADKLCYTIAGHVHSYIEDTLGGGIPSIVTGGAGARIAPVEGLDAPYHHYVEFSLEKDGWRHRRVDISFSGDSGPKDPGLRALLESACTAECRAFVRYTLLAEDAAGRGLQHLAELYRTLAQAEFYHARNFYYTTGNMVELPKALLASIEGEQREARVLYPEGRACAERVGDGLSAAAYADTRSAEAGHAELLIKARPALELGKDIPAESYYVCTSCGATFAGEHPGTCPICGAPADKIEKTC